jgi:hypothetical protein
MTNINVSDISKQANYTLVHKTNKALKYEATSVSVKGTVCHQVYKLISNSNKEFIGIISLVSGAIISGISITEFDIYSN